MGKFKALLGISLLTTSLFAQAKVLTCTLERIQDKKKDIVRLDLSQPKSYAESKGLEVGQYYYSYVTYVSSKSTILNIDVILYESNYAQDEVGGVSCAYDPKMGSRPFCVEQITDDKNKKIMTFYCRVSG